MSHATKSSLALLKNKWQSSMIEEQHNPIHQVLHQINSAGQTQWEECASVSICVCVCLCVWAERSNKKQFYSDSRCSSVGALLPRSHLALWFPSLYSASAVGCSATLRLASRSLELWFLPRTQDSPTVSPVLVTHPPSHSVRVSSLQASGQGTQEE